jgi:hypothetical protein
MFTVLHRRQNNESGAKYLMQESGPQLEQDLGSKPLKYLGKKFSWQNLVTKYRFCDEETKIYVNDVVDLYVIQCYLC